MTTQVSRHHFDTTTPQKAWASTQMRGLINYILPTFLEDGATLDEDGIRLDVQASIAHGFFATTALMPGCAAEDPRWKTFNRVLRTEAGKQLTVQGQVFGSDLASDLTSLREVERMGFELVGVAPIRLPPQLSAKEAFNEYAKRIRATDLPVLLFAGNVRGRPQPLELFDRLGDLPNVVGMKVSHPVPIGALWQLCERVADRILIGPVNLDFAPVLAREFQIQWSGQWNAESVQTPERQLGRELLAATAAKDFEQSMRVYNEMRPVLEHFFWLQATDIFHGSHPWQHNKYYSWLTGGNGGLLPLDREADSNVSVLDAKARAGIRDAYATAGLKVTDAADEQFIVGRAAWARGVRPGRSGNLPKYSRT